MSTPSASGVYNGKPLTAAGAISGFVNGESVPFETTGSQTEVGTSNNTYAIDWAAAGATAKQANYTVSESIGKLTVTRVRRSRGRDAPAAIQASTTPGPRAT